MPVDKVDWTLTELHDGTMVRMTLVNGELRPVTMKDGTDQVAPVKGKGTKTGKDRLFQVKLKAYKRTFLNVPDADVLAIANEDMPLGQDPKIRVT